MSFEWQDQDRAAETLGVSVEKLKEWIDSGHAPSRTHKGKVQVLIEHVEDGEEEEEEEEPEGAGTAGPGKGGYPLDVVSKRELQLAGGMVHAWQRLAETTEHTLSRSRRAGMLAWAIVAILALSGGAGLWWSTREVTTAEARIALAEYDLEQVRQRTAEDREQIADLRAHVDRLTDELSTVLEDFLKASERASQAEVGRERLAEQLVSAEELERERVESHRALVAALEATIGEQRERIGAMEETLQERQREAAEILARLRDSEARSLEDGQAVAEATRSELVPLRNELDEARRSQTLTEAELSEMKASLEALTSQLEDLAKEGE